MNRVLEAVRAERASLIARLATLKEIERLWTLADSDDETVQDSAAVPAPPAPKTQRREPSRALPPARRIQPQPPRAGLSPSDVAQRAGNIRLLVAEHEPISFADIVRLSGLSVGVAKNALNRLREAGIVDGTGNTHNRRYHLQATLDAQAAKTGGARSLKVSRCRDDILQTIASDPGQWSEQRIADAGAWDREQVADACGRLLLDGAIVLDPDGTYRPARAPEAA